MITESQVLEALSQIIDPDLHQDIVSLGFVKDLTMTNGAVGFTIELTTPACPVKEKFRAQATALVQALPGVTSVTVNMTANVRSMPRAQGAVLPHVKHVIAVASGKGGVGKSTVSANLACALQQTGATVGLLDADIYGPSQPKMFGVEHPPLTANDTNQIIPWNQHGLKIMSMGFLVDDNTPVIWRGPMVHNILSQFLRQVEWGTLDYLIIDLPPGTGDAQLTITQMVPLSGAIIVTTPQEVAIQIASRGLQMFGQVNVPVLGFVENMSYLDCPHCHTQTTPFRRGGTRKAAEIHNVPFLGEIPLDPAIALSGDNGIPTVVQHPDSPAAAVYRELAGKIGAALSTLHARSDAQAQVANLSLDWK